MRPNVRLLLQTVIAIVLLPSLMDYFGGSWAWRATFALGVVAWLVAYVNAFNFMDGINGIAVAQASIAGLAFYAIGRDIRAAPLQVGGAILFGSLVGFAPFNFPRARMFLGDVGSYFFGAWIGVLVVFGLRVAAPFEAMVAPLSLYLADTGVTLVQRVRAGHQWNAPHREHVYQRLVQLGWTQVETTLYVGFLIGVCAVLGLASLTDSLALRVAADALIVAVLVVYLATPSSRRARRVARRNR